MSQTFHLGTRVGESMLSVVEDDAEEWLSMESGGVERGEVVCAASLGLRLKTDAKRRMTGCANSVRRRQQNIEYTRD